MRAASVRLAVVVVLAAIVGAYGVTRCGVRHDNNVLRLVALKSPRTYRTLVVGYNVFWFTTPLIVLQGLVSLGLVFGRRREAPPKAGKLPPYPPVQQRDELLVVLGERHHPTKREPAESPTWLTLNEKALVTGIKVFGAIGAHKTRSVMSPLADQVLGFAADDPQRRAGGLVLEVKGDFCHMVRRKLKKYGREEDYLRLSVVDPEWCYNGFANDLDPYSHAFSIASLLNQLFGKDKQPFWQQAYTNLVRFLILGYRLLDDYVCLTDVYRTAIAPKSIEAFIARGDERYQTASLLVIEPWVLTDEKMTRRLGPFAEEFSNDRVPRKSAARASHKLEELLIQSGIPYEVQEQVGEGEVDEDQREMWLAFKRWYHDDWMHIHDELRTSIVEGISVFLALFDSDPRMRRVFSPSKLEYEGKALPGSRRKPLRPLPPLRRLIDEGRVLCLDLPEGTNPALARVIGTLLKLDFQRSCLSRIPDMARDPERKFRPVLFLCDEYHAFATCGQNDPGGDEKFFALSRQAKVIPVVATQSISSLKDALPGDTWRTLIQTFRTTIFLCLNDDFSQKIASALCGQEDKPTVSLNVSESSQDAKVSFLTGKTHADKGSVTVSRTYSVRQLPRFSEKIFGLLRNAETITLWYDGVNPHEAEFVYLKPDDLDKNTTYFEQLKRGLL